MCIHHMWSSVHTYMLLHASRSFYLSLKSSEFIPHNHCIQSTFDRAYTCSESLAKVTSE